MEESQIVNRLLLPAIVAFITTVILTPLIGLFVQSYIEVRKNRIIKDKTNQVNLMILVKSIIGNLNVVLEEAEKDTKKLLIPTVVDILATRLNSVENDAKEMVRILVHLGEYHPELKQKEDIFIRNIAHVVGGSMRIKDNIEKNNQHTINGKTGFRGINVESLEGYIGNLTTIADAIEELPTPISKWKAKVNI